MSECNCQSQRHSTGGHPVPGAWFEEFWPTSVPFPPSAPWIAGLGWTRSRLKYYMDDSIFIVDADDRLFIRTRGDVIRIGDASHWYVGEFSPNNPWFSIGAALAAAAAYKYLTGGEDRLKKPPSQWDEIHGIEDQEDTGDEDQNGGTDTSGGLGFHGGEGCPDTFPPALC